MSDSFVRLQCPACGAKLEVHPDMDRFACGYCGGEVLVQRRGGTVALKAVVEGIRQVQKGTDRTAAELALVRLEKELRELRARRATISQSTTTETGRAAGQRVTGAVLAVFGMVLVIIGLLTVHPMLVVGFDLALVAVGLVGLAGGAGLLIASYKRVASANAARARAMTEQGLRLQDLEMNVIGKEGEIARTRQMIASD